MSKSGIENIEITCQTDGEEGGEEQCTQDKNQ